MRCPDRIRRALGTFLATVAQRHQVAAHAPAPRREFVLRQYRADHRRRPEWIEPLSLRLRSPTAALNRLPFSTFFDALRLTHSHKRPVMLPSQRPQEGTDVRAFVEEPHRVDSHLW